MKAHSETHFEPFCCRCPLINYPGLDEESTSDNEVTINNKDTIPSSVRIPILNNGGKKRRSRSSSPSSVSTSSSREENPGNSNSKRLRRETSLPLYDGSDFFMKWI